MTRRLVLVLLLGAAFSTFAADLPRLPAESDTSYRCRQVWVPQARACTAACEASLADDRAGRWACVQSCTRDHLAAMAECRAAAVPLARERDGAAPVAAR